MEIFRFKTSDKDKSFDVKLLKVEEQLTIQYEYILSNPYLPNRNLKRILFYALVNGQIEIVELTKRKYNEMIVSKLNTFDKIPNNNGVYYRFNIDTKVVSQNRELTILNFKPLVGELYNPKTPEVKAQISEFDFTFNKAIESLKEFYSKDGDWSEKIKFL